MKLSKRITYDLYLSMFNLFEKELGRNEILESEGHWLTWNKNKLRRMSHKEERLLNFYKDALFR